MVTNGFEGNIKGNRKDVVLNLTSSWSCGRRHMRDIRTLLTAPISRISSRPQGRDDEGRKDKENADQVVPDNKIKRHSRKSLSGIPTASNNTQGGDPRTLRAAASGMTTNFNSSPLTLPYPSWRGNTNNPLPPRGQDRGLRSAFTLIELLIVVLIIGILTAIALPQYQKAVEKSRGMQALVLMKALVQGQNAYYLTHGSYAEKLDELEVTVPSSWQPAEDNKLVYRDYSDVLANESWSIGWTGKNGYGWRCLRAERLEGKYKGASFMYCYRKDNNSQFKSFELEHLYCQEARTLLSPQGVYCAKLFQGTYVGANQDPYFDLP